MAAARNIVIVAVDNSETSRNVVEYAASQVTQGSDVRLVHVQPAIEPGNDSHQQDDAFDLEEETGFKASLTTHLLPRMRTRFPEASSVLLSISGTSGPREIGGALCSYADDQQA
ncbi:hypothetical protein WJX72_008868 [[Myrmecia] bisecta]|uniref:UspA domain-containing protein n=1 Tax=[Myrmecia] bisecta TaxID=41462 RepID=A0AAW1PGX9_9CHLO